jgi:hypothetical protein
MIDAKQAVQIAKVKAAEMLKDALYDLEELERDSYKDRDVWSITLSFVRNPQQAIQAQINPFTRLGSDSLRYKRFLIDAATGELVAMKLREIASQ